MTTLVYSNDFHDINLESFDFDQSVVSHSPIDYLDLSDAPILSSEDLVEIEFDSSNRTNITGGEAFDLGIFDGDVASYVIEDLTSRRPTDLYEFTVDQSNDFNFILDGLAADADLYIFNEDFELLGVSDNYDADADALAGNLEEGTYYLGITSFDGVATDYNLTISSGDYAFA